MLQRAEIPSPFGYRVENAGLWHTSRPHHPASSHEPAPRHFARRSRSVRCWTHIDARRKMLAKTKPREFGGKSHDQADGSPHQRTEFAVDARRYARAVA